MKNDSVKVGMLVAVNTLADGQVYKVAEITKNPFIVRLTYKVEDGTEVEGGYIDTSCLRKPSKAQLKNSVV